MQKTDNQAVNSSRDNILARMKDRFPDRRYAGQMGQDGQMGTDDLDQSISEYLDELIADRDANSQAHQKLKDLLDSDPKAAEFLDAWIQSGDPRSALVGTFGDDLGDLATEEGRGKFNEQLQGWRDRRTQNDSLNAEAEKNWDESLNKAQAFADARGLSTDQMSEIMIRLVNRTANGLMNKYDEADFENELKALNYDSAVKTAEKDGEVRGRNQKIAAQQRSRMAQNNPPALSGQGLRVGERSPKVDSSNPWAGIE